MLYSVKNIGYCFSFRSLFFSFLFSHVSLIFSFLNIEFQEWLTALFTKPPDGLPPYRTGSGGRSVQQFPIDFFPFCRERPVTKEPAAL